MPKLYHDEGCWVVPGQQGRKATRVDVPNAPIDLADWLNARHVPPAAAPLEDPAPTVPPLAQAVSDEDRYTSPFSAETTIQRIDASLIASAIGLMLDPKALAIVAEAFATRFLIFKGRLEG